jgi:hypothetical protein
MDGGLDSLHSVPPLTLPPRLVSVSWSRCFNHGSFLTHYKTMNSTWGKKEAVWQAVSLPDFVELLHCQTYQEHQRDQRQSRIRSEQVCKAKNATGISPVPPALIHSQDRGEVWRGCKDVTLIRAEWVQSHVDHTLPAHGAEPHPISTVLCQHAPSYLPHTRLVLVDVSLSS